MKWLKKNKSKEALHPSFLGKILNKVNNQLIKLAESLRKKMEGYSIKKQKAILLIFCVSFFSASLFVLLNSFKKKHYVSFNATPIKMIPLLPTHQSNRIFLSVPELKRIHFFISYLDSLNRTTKGKQLKDSLLLNRSHLMDSLIYLDNLYTEILKSETNGK